MERPTSLQGDRASFELRPRAGRSRQIYLTRTCESRGAGCRSCASKPGSTTPPFQHHPPCSSALLATDLCVRGRRESVIRRAKTCALTCGVHRRRGYELVFESRQRSLQQTPPRCSAAALAAVTSACERVLIGHCSARVRVSSFRVSVVRGWTPDKASGNVGRVAVPGIAAGRANF